MPIREFICPKHGKFEKLFTGQFDETYTSCPGKLGIPCLRISPLIPYSITAKRNPKYGEG